MHELLLLLLLLLHHLNLLVAATLVQLVSGPKITILCYSVHKEHSVRIGQDLCTHKSRFNLVKLESVRTNVEI